jgi:hypothetical protein
MNAGTLLERTVNVAILCGVLYGITLMRSATNPSSQPPLYSIGETAPSLSTVSYRSSDRTLILFVSSSCHFCTDSMAFYRDLVADRDSKRLSLRIIAVGHEPNEVLKRYFDANGVRMDQTISVDKSAWVKSSLTPQQIVVDRTGLIRGTWPGKLSVTHLSDLKRSLGFVGKPDGLISS